MMMMMMMMITIIIHCLYRVTNALIYNTTYYSTRVDNIQCMQRGMISGTFSMNETFVWLIIGPGKLSLKDFHNLV